MAAMNESTGQEISPRQSRRRRGSAPRNDAPPAVWPGVSGGRYRPLRDADAAGIHDAALSLLAEVGLSQAIPPMVERVTARGGRYTGDGRLTFPRGLVEDVIAGARRDFILHGQTPGHEIDPSGTKVHVGSGGASPSILDIETGRYRESRARDIYDAARLVDTLDNIHLFSRPLVARDARDPRHLDVNTAYACLSGTSKHVCISASAPENVDAVADVCAELAGSWERFEARPFLTIMICHVVPPMRFAEEACRTIENAVSHGFPIQVISAGQAGATSPATIAGSLAQAVAETLAGLVFAYLVDPRAKAVFAPKPLVADLRTGAMCGGGGEQAVLMAAAAQMGRFYDLPTSSIAGITDSKIPDAQHGYEKCLAVSLAAHAGANIITQACGMQASLLGTSFEGYVADNDMLGAILRSVRGVEMDPETVGVDVIAEVARGEGHYLGHSQTLASMKRDYVYPEVADRRTPADWEEQGGKDMRTRARERARRILSEHFPGHVAPATDDALRARYDILVPRGAMAPAQQFPPSPNVPVESPRSDARTVEKR